VNTTPLPLCLAPHPFVPAILCRLPLGHGNDHAGRAYWTTKGDEGPATVRLPPIGETVRRRPPVPPVQELRGSELLRALADELDRDDLGGEEL
jgi:hypothetical protein